MAIWLSFPVAFSTQGNNSRPSRRSRTPAQSGWVWGAMLALALAMPLGAAEPAGAAAAEPPPPVVEQHDFLFPRRREVDGYTLTLHAPQIQSWPNFERFAALMAIEVVAPDGGAPRFATVTVQGSTEVDLARDVVRVIDSEVANVKFSGSEPPDAYREAVRHASRDGVLEIPLTLFVAAVAEDVLADPPPPGFNVEPPTILARSKPALLLFLDGSPVGKPIAGTSLEVIVNANGPVFRTAGDKPQYFLLDHDRWYTSRALEKGWKTTRDLPPDFANLPAEPQFQAVRAAVPAPAVSGPAATVIFASTPTELIETEGRAKLEEIPGTGGLAFVTNTESPLFKLNNQWYFLTAGRWFSAPNYEKGPWTYVAHPPEAFSSIPTNHETAEVRASVPGTIEAKVAAVEALLPTRVTARRGDTPPITVTYTGDPQFEAISGISVSRAQNTGYDVLQVDGRYYLLYRGIWYLGDAPQGPWSVAASVPDAIYAIPPNSPAYHMTQVTIASTSEREVVYVYPASYSSSVYVVYGVPYYGTGWYYYPWIWADYYYPYWGGGYSYAAWYNPVSGRRGYVETAWDGDEWASHGETFNPRTGIGTETDRYYNADDNRSEMERTTQRGDEWVHTERNTDFDSGTQDIQRETSRGGSSDLERSRTGGGFTTEGSVTTGGGNEFQVSREWEDGQRASTITGDGGSISTETGWHDGNRVTSIEGSGGGQTISSVGDGGRTTIGVSGSGDIYAGHDGNVYKKTEGGWQEYDNGNWQDAQSPRRSEGGAADSVASRPAGQGGLGTATPRDPALRPQPQQPLRADMAQLQRDHEARQRSQQQYQQRAASRDRGGFAGGYQGHGGFSGMGGGLRGGMGGGRRR